MRSVKKWVGKTDDSMPPPRVRARIFQRFEGICQETGRKITAADAWDLDHTIAIADGGANDEDNLRPVLRKAHQAKTAAENSERAVVRRKQNKHLGIKKPRRHIIAGSKDSGWKKPLNGPAVRRKP